MEIIEIRTRAVGKVVRSTSSWCWWWSLPLPDPEPSADQEGSSAGLVAEGNQSPETPPAFGCSARTGLSLGLPVPPRRGREDRRSQASHRGDCGWGTFCPPASMPLCLGLVYKEDLGGPGAPRLGLPCCLLWGGSSPRDESGPGPRVGVWVEAGAHPQTSSSIQGRPRRPRW